MKIDRALNLQMQVLQRIKEIYITAEIMGLSSDQISERINAQVYAHLAEKKAPQWLISFIKGYQTCVSITCTVTNLFLGFDMMVYFIQRIATVKIITKSVGLVQMSLTLQYPM